MYTTICYSRFGAGLSLPQPYYKSKLKHINVKLTPFDYKFKLFWTYRMNVFSSYLNILIGIKIVDYPGLTSRHIVNVLEQDRIVTKTSPDIFKGIARCYTNRLLIFLINWVELVKILEQTINLQHFHILFLNTQYSYTVQF